MHAVLGRGSDHVAVLQRFLTRLSVDDAAALRRLIVPGSSSPADGNG